MDNPTSLIEIYHIALNSVIGVGIAIGLWTWRRNITLLEQVNVRIHHLEIRTKVLETRQNDIKRLEVAIDALRQHIDSNFSEIRKHRDQ